MRRGYGVVLAPMHFATRGSKRTQRGVDAVRAGAGDQSEIERRRHASVSRWSRASCMPLTNFSLASSGALFCLNSASCVCRQRLFLRQRHGQRIAMLAVDAEFVMQVRAGRKAGHADVADDLALAHVLADASRSRTRTCGRTRC